MGWPPISGLGVNITGTCARYLRNFASLYVTVKSAFVSRRVALIDKN